MKLMEERMKFDSFRPKTHITRILQLTTTGNPTLVLMKSQLGFVFIKKEVSRWAKDGDRDKDDGDVDDDDQTVCVWVCVSGSGKVRVWVSNCR